MKNQKYRNPFNFEVIFIIPRRSRRDIVLAASVRPSIPSVRPSGFISQYLLVRFDSFLVQMISTIDSRYPLSLVKIDPLTLELLPLFKYRQLKCKTYISFFCVIIFTFHHGYYIQQLLTIHHDYPVPVD